MLRHRPSVVLSRAVLFQQEFTVCVGDGEHGVVLGRAGVDVRVWDLQRAGKTGERFERVFKSTRTRRNRSGFDGSRGR